VKTGDNGRENTLNNYGSDSYQSSLTIKAKILRLKIVMKGSSVGVRGRDNL